MSKESTPKKTRSIKKVTEGSNTAELEAKIAQLEAKLANLSSQVKPAEQKPAQTSPKPQPRPAASGPTHGTLPAGMKPAEAPKPQSAPETSSVHEPSAGEVAPAYAKISSTGYTGNKYFATRKRLSYHPSDKQFTGSVSTTSTVTTTAPPPPAPEPKHESQTSTSRGTLPAGTKPQEKKSLWKAKGSDVAETYVAEEEPKPQPRPAASGPTHGTLPAGMKPAEAPKPEPKPQPRPAASGPTHGTLPAGMKPAEAPKPQSAPETSSVHEPSAGEVAPAYAKISSTGYTGNKYFATRKRLSYHPSDKQFTGSVSTTSTAPQLAAEPAKPKSTFRTTLPAGFKA
ncbi:MAG: hypothetical protein KGI05_06430 [Thaumarchaeota archaeon]|nr:hypothetical protein [Nitrososphaerota archaeon]